MNSWVCLHVQNPDMSTKIESNNLLMFEESDCCGNGCANCVLDVKIPSSFDVCHEGRKNVILNYTHFKLVTKQNYENLHEVLDLHFKWSNTDDRNPAECILDIPAGHHIMMRLTDENIQLVRPYSPYWVNPLECEFKILVNLKMNGVMSQFIENLPVASEVMFRGPIGSFKHEKFSTSKVLCIVAQGVAVAPTIRIVEQILADDSDETRILHLICASDLSHTYFRKKYREFSGFWNYKNAIFLAKENNNLKGRLLYKETVNTQKLNADMLKEQLINYQGVEWVFVIAGTRAFQDSIKLMVESCKLNVEKETIILL